MMELDRLAETAMHCEYANTKRSPGSLLCNPNPGHTGDPRMHYRPTGTAAIFTKELVQERR